MKVMRVSSVLCALMIVACAVLGAVIEKVTGSRFLAPETVAMMFTSQTTSEGKPTNVGIAIVTNLGFAAFNERDVAAIAGQFLDAR